MSVPLGEVIVAEMPATGGSTVDSAWRGCNVDLE